MGARKVLSFGVAAAACALLTLSLALAGCAGQDEREFEVFEAQEGVEATETQEKDEEAAPKTEEDPKTEAEPEPEPEPEPELEPLVPADLAAGTVLQAEDIERAGGVDAFFWSEEIPDAVFARMEGRSFKEDCTVPRADLRYVRVLHANAEGDTLVGELVVNRRVAQEVVDIFRQLYDAGYPIRRMRLVDDYDADDVASCEDDNTSSFNFRVIAGTSQISNHAYGLAIDINTYENPYYIVHSGYLCPADATRYLDRSLEEPYMIHVGDLCYQLFTERGWGWGGNWNDPKDYQHFEKPQALSED